ncbi:hypothetical protein Mapa_011205 [Marchantia paleacea]|nr:hypothetical protein Mapa_011205 [Marchantia paleacea]
MMDISGDGKVLDAAQLQRITEAWIAFSEMSDSLLQSGGGMALLWSEVEKAEWANSVQTLGNQGLAHLVAGHFLDALERSFKQEVLPKFLQHFEEFPKLKSVSKRNIASINKLHNWVETTLPRALAEICAAKSSQEDCLSVLAHVFNFDFRGTGAGVRDGSMKSTTNSGVALFSQYQTSVNAMLLTSAPKYISEVMNLYCKARLEEFSNLVKKQRSNRSPHGGGDSDDDEDGANSTCNQSGEDDDMESAPGSSRTSMYVEDMDVSGSGSLYGKRAVADDDADHQMEGIEISEASDLKLGAGTALNEVVEIVGEDWVTEVGNVVRHLRELGFASMSEEGYASAIYSLLKVKIHAVATKRYEKPVLRPVSRWIEAVPLRFLSVILAFSGSGTSGGMTASSTVPTAHSTDEILNEGILRWRSRLQSFANETLGDLRVSELFDIIVDFPESLAAVEDLKQCLANTGDHAKLVDSFRDALKQRLLTAGAATTDILLQYISTIKALRTLDQTGVVLEAVGEPIKEYLRGRKDTIRCIVTMLTDDAGPGGSGGLSGVGESLLEELSRGASSLENADSEDDADVDGDEAWAAAERWEPDPVDADPSRTSKSRRLMDIIGILVGIYGSKELFVNEYRVMLAEKLLNKSDYDTDRNIRTLELLKLRFGESNMHSCEIMLKDVADSKRINANIKASKSSNDPLVSQIRSSRLPASTSQEGGEGNMANGKIEQELTLDVVDSTIISSLFWPPFQTETIKIPEAMEHVLDEYAQRYHALKAPRQLQWKKHLGTVKLELQFEDRSSQFVVSPLHASIIMQFESQSRWLASDLALAVGVPLVTLRRRIMLWVNQGVLVESPGPRDGEWLYTIVENIGEVGNRTAGPSAAGDAALPLLGEEDGESAVASMEDQWQQEMSVFESYVVGMLTNFESLPLDRIHNMLKMFVSDPPYDKSLPQLQGFLARLVSEEKLEFREGSYRRRQ